MDRQNKNETKIKLLKIHNTPTKQKSTQTTVSKIPAFTFYTPYHVQLTDKQQILTEN
jgi:hypothetical protein